MHSIPWKISEMFQFSFLMLMFSVFFHFYVFSCQRPIVICEIKQRNEIKIVNLGNETDETTKQKLVICETTK